MRHLRALFWGTRMTPLFSLATAIAAAGAPLPAPSAPVEVAAPPAQGVTVYPPAFFATANVSTALDMVNRLPGFSLDTGASVRGF